MKVTLAQYQHKSVSELSALSATQLMQLQCEADKAFQFAKRDKEHIEDAIALKYSLRAHTLRQQLGKESGIVHFDDEGIRISTDVPKKTEWDQTKLRDIAKRISEGGEDPSDYIEISYKVAERKFSAWPETLRNAFAPARLFQTGKASFRLLRDEGR